MDLLVIFDSNLNVVLGIGADFVIGCKMRMGMIWEIERGKSRVKADE